MGLWECPSGHREVAAPTLSKYSNTRNCCRCQKRMERIAVGIHHQGTLNPIP